MGLAKRAVPAKFDQTSQRRRSLLAKVHVAKKQLAMAEDDYRQIVLDVSGQMSASKCTEQQLASVVERMKKLGFQPVPKNGPKVAMHPMARKARALWISLYHLGAVHNRSEQALEAFAARQLGCDRLVWARQSSGDKLIEALKAMARRNGWSQTSEEGRALDPIALQEALCDAILLKIKELKGVPYDWGLHNAMSRLCGIENSRQRAWSAEDYAELASALGKKLREFGGAAQ